MDTPILLESIERRACVRLTPLERRSDGVVLMEIFLDGKRLESGGPLETDYTVRLRRPIRVDGLRAIALSLRRMAAGTASALTEDLGVPDDAVRLGIAATKPGRFVCVAEIERARVWMRIELDADATGLERFARSVETFVERA